MGIKRQSFADRVAVGQTGNEVASDIIASAKMSALSLYVAASVTATTLEVQSRGLDGTWYPIETINLAAKPGVYHVDVAKFFTTREVRFVGDANVATGISYLAK